MELLTRLNRLLTPVPRSRSTVRPKTDSEIRRQVQSADIKGPLLQLLRAESLQAGPAREALAKLREVADQCGPVLTATAIIRTLEKTPKEDNAGFRLDRNHGYRVAAGLYLEHIKTELRELEESSRPLGPRVFAGYCREFIDCYIFARAPLSAIESAVILADEIAAKALTESPHAETFAALAAECIRTTIDTINQWRETESANVAPVHGGPDQGKHSRQLIIEPAHVRYLETLLAAFERLRQSFTEAARASQSGPGNERGNLLLTLEALAGELKDAPYKGLLGTLTGRRGELRETLRAGAGKPFFHQACLVIKTQGDDEARLGLKELARRRYFEAKRLYAQCQPPSPTPPA